MNKTDRECNFNDSRKYNTCTLCNVEITIFVFGCRNGILTYAHSARSREHSVVSSSFLLETSVKLELKLCIHTRYAVCTYTTTLHKYGETVVYTSYNKFIDTVQVNLDRGVFFFCAEYVL